MKHAPGAHSLRTTSSSDGGSGGSSRAASSHRAARRTAKQLERERQELELMEGGAAQARFSMTLRRTHSEQQQSGAQGAGRPPRPLFKPPVRAPLE